MKKIITLFFSVMVLAGCTTSPAQNSTDSNILDGSDTDSSDESIFVTATFIVGEGVTPIAPQTVIVGEKFKKPNDPIKDEYTFDGWFTDDSYSSLFNFDVSYTTDQTIYAKWDKITYEYYLYGRLNDADVFLPDDYKQEQYRLSTPHEDDSDAIKAIYNFHFMPDDEIHVIRFGSDGNEKIYNLDDSEEYGRGYYDLLLYENGISLRFIRYDEWVINFLSDSDAGDVFASFTKGTSDGTFDYYEANNIEVTAGQKLFLSYAWDYNPGDYFGIMCENEWPIVNNEPWVEVIHTPSLLYPDATTTVYEFKKDAKYDVTVCVRKDCTYNDENMKVTFNIVENTSIINNDEQYNLPLIKSVLLNWIEQDNQFGKSVVLAKLRNNINLDEIKLINIDNNGLSVYLTTESPAGSHLRKMYFTNDTFNQSFISKALITSSEMLAALKSIQGTEIYFEIIIQIDKASEQSKMNERAKKLLTKIEANADAVFAFETTAEMVNFNQTTSFRIVLYTTTNHLLEYSIGVDGENGKETMLQGQDFNETLQRDVLLIDNMILFNL
ncbi:MAG: InlB B-repeat-containing protein [Bacilli bacterium]|nr:InlB B-repeat-containing protein [Bacilli bacterium]